MRKITYLTFLTSALFASQVSAQAPKVQIIHNSADAAADQVDIYLNDSLLLDDFAFRTASPFVNVSPGPVNVVIAPSSSNSVADSIASFNFNLAPNTNYVIVASGIVSSNGYNPSIPFDLSVSAIGQTAAQNPANTDLLVYHGGTDAPEISVWETSGTDTEIFNNFSYGDFEGYLPLPTDDYVLELRDTAGVITYKSYDAPLAQLNAQGLAGVVVASGFLNPSANSNGPEFGLFVALPLGGALLPLPESTAEIQVIHNCADAAASLVDVYVNDSLAIDNFAFRTATSFLEVPAGVDLEVAIAPSNSTSSSAALATFTYNLDAGQKYTIVAAGIVSPTGYNPSVPFTLHVSPNAQTEATDSTNTDILVYHGSTDAPVVSIWQPDTTLLFSEFAFGDFEGYLNLSTDDYVLQIRDNSGNQIVKAYDAPLATLGLEGEAIVVVASGFLNPAANSNGPAFGLWVALPSGGPLVQLPESKARVQIIHNSADLAAAEVDIYLNGTLLLDTFSFRSATPFVDVPAGVNIQIGIAPGNSNSVADTLVSYNYVLESGQKYVVVASGIISQSGYSPDEPFDLYVFDNAREEALDSNKTDVLVFHGSTDAPTVSVWETGVGAGELFNNFSYNDYEGYLELNTLNYTLEVRNNAGTSTVASYNAPLQTLGLDGEAITVLASGFLNPAQNSNGSAFGLWVALASGGPLVQLPINTPSGIQNSNQADVFAVYPNPSRGAVWIQMPNTGDLQTELKVYSSTGALIERQMVNLNGGNGNMMQMNTADWSGGLYHVTLSTSKGQLTQRIVVE
jgi:hypothetical protein